MIESGWNTKQKKRISQSNKKDKHFPRADVARPGENVKLSPETLAPRCCRTERFIQQFPTSFVPFMHIPRVFFVSSFLQYRVRVIYDFSELFQRNQLVMECS
jgi:hypothetical protein